MRWLAPLLFLFLAACELDHPRDSGERLARQHCGSCHRYPEPGVLDRATWSESVLPNMALRLGVTPEDIESTQLRDNYFHLTEHGLFPKPPVMERSEWRAIRDFYLRLAPDSLPRPGGNYPPTGQFVVQAPEVGQRGLLPSTTALYLSPSGGELLAGVYGSGQIFIQRDEEAPEALMNAPSMLVDVLPLPMADEGRKKFLMTFLGQVIRPDAPAAGVVVEAELEGGQLSGYDLLPLPTLHRPTQTLLLDLDDDPEEEMLIAEFGYFTGALAYWDKQPDGLYLRRMIREEPGALQVEPLDANRDGRTDLLVLFAHGDERLSLFTATGEGTFSERVLLRFPPVYGSSSFAWTDIDGDGLEDILYTCGDNADLSPVVKPYHGIYLFRNRGDWTFEQVLHQPLPGAYKALARDFDEDGDQDLAAVAFFVDEGPPESPGFLYLEQTGPLTFQASTAPVGPLGRWITLEAGDVDADGDTDLVLGNAYGLSGLDMIKAVKQDAQSPWIYLLNQSPNLQ